MSFLFSLANGVHAVTEVTVNKSWQSMWCALFDHNKECPKYQGRGRERNKGRGEKEREEERMEKGEEKKRKKRGGFNC